MKNLELKLIPPKIALITLALMGLTALCLPSSEFSLTVRLVASVLWGMVGAAIAIPGIKQFKRVQTTVIPTKPEEASVLVTSGIFKYTRNPMYLGLVCCLIGLVILFGHFVLLIWVVGFIAYITRFQIIPEERALEKVFPEEFNEYQQRVRRWI